MEATKYTEILLECKKADQLEQWKDYIEMKNPPKKLITGYEVCDVTVKDSPEEKLVFQFYKNQLKYLLIYADYKSFLEETEHWEVPTLDGEIEKEAIKLWGKTNTEFEIGKSYEWGCATIDYDKYLGRAMILCSLV